MSDRGRGATSLPGRDRARRRYRRFAGIHGQLTADGPCAVHCDGDPVEPADRVFVQLRPRALEILVPAGVAADPSGPFSA